MSNSTLGRRRFLQVVGGTAAAVAGVASVGGCTSGSHDDGASRSSAGLELPKYRRFEGVKPDLPGDGNHVPDAFLAYPTDPIQAISEPPGDGGEVTVACAWVGVVPPTVTKNAYWQELNKRLNTTLNYHAVPSADYSARAATVLASGDLPDMMQIPNDLTRLPAVLQARFADLTDYLAGDAILEYPFLANQPPHVWPQSVYAGRIYGMRTSLFSYGAFMLTRRDILNELGLSVDQVTDAQSFAQLCRDVTDKSTNRWALANPRNIVNFVTEMLGKPANVAWFEKDGVLSSSRDTDEYRQALEFVLGLWKEGLFHPDSLALSGSDEIVQFTGGRIVIDYRGGNQWETRTTNENLDVTAIPPVAFDGKGMGVKGLGTGTWTLTGINREAHPDRIRMLLRIANWMAAPFGTQEYYFRRYGIEGVHHTRAQGGAIALSATGKSETRLPNAYIASPPPEVFVPGYANVTRELHEFIQRVAPTGIQPANAGLWSKTADQKERKLDQDLNNVIDGIFRGQRSLKDFDDAMDSWRRNGGDDIRDEYEEAFEERANA